MSLPTRFTAHGRRIHSGRRCAHRRCRWHGRSYGQNVRGPHRGSSHLVASLGPGDEAVTAPLMSRRPGTPIGASITRAVQSAPPEARDCGGAAATSCRAPYRVMSPPRIARRRPCARSPPRSVCSACQSRQSGATPAAVAAAAVVLLLLAAGCLQAQAVDEPARHRPGYRRGQDFARRARPPATRCGSCWPGRPPRRRPGRWTGSARSRPGSSGRRPGRAGSVGSRLRALRRAPALGGPLRSTRKKLMVAASATWPSPSSSSAS